VTWDVVVAGGGMAGIGAACRSASLGAKVLLIERLEILGGLGTAGGVGNFCYGDPSLPHGQGRVLREIWRRLESCGAIGAAAGWHPLDHPPFFWNQPFDHQVLALILQELCEEAGVELLLATDAIGADVADGRMQAITVHNRSLIQRIPARSWIDATGDGILARHAGGEALPPDPDHPGCIPPGHMVFLAAGGTAPPVHGAPPPFQAWPEPVRLGLKLKCAPGEQFDTSTGQGYSDASRTFRRRIGAVVAAARERSGGSGLGLGHIAPMLGLRDGVRVRGDHVLQVDELRRAEPFADAVAHGCFPVDSAAAERQSLPPYRIPYRSLLVHGLENVLVAGRCFSATRLALSSARIMVTASLMGEAAGAAASLAVRRGTSLRDVPAGDIRSALCRDDDDPELARRLGA
jgi:hypothetical protein